MYTMIQRRRIAVDARVTPSRREALRQLLARALLTTEELAGRPQLRLRDLEDLPDETLRQVVPRLAPGVEIVVDGGAVKARRRSGEPPLLLFDRRSEELLAFNRIDGRRSLGEAAAELARELSWDDQAAWGRVRKLFLHLVHLGVCFPRDPLP